MSSRVRIKDLWAEQRMFLGRSFAATMVAAALGLLLIGKLVYLQIVRHDYYVELSQGNRVRREPVPASRGLILDRHGQVLVDNEPTYQLELIREQTPNLDDTLQRLSAIGLVANEDIPQIKRVVASRRSFDSVPIRLRLTEYEIGSFAVHRHEFQGVDLRARQTRHYPYGELGVHAFGYVASISEEDAKRLKTANSEERYAGTTLIGKLGVESAYEDQLHGRNGYREILVNAQGRSVERQGAYSPDLGSESPVAGDDLILSIDLATQQAAEKGLGDRRGAVVAIDPQNGDVIALASRPGFDPSLFGRGLTRAEYAVLTSDIDLPLFNRALRGTYPSGSTIKPAMALAGLTYNVITADTHEHCNGVFYLPNSRLAYREGKTGRHGSMDVVHAIAKSCDVFFYDLASKLGVDRIAAFMAPFGLGTETGIDIGGEKPGLLPTPAWKKKAFKRPQDQVWFPGETVNFGVGQGYLLVTPIQLAHMTSVIANRGHSYKPRVVAGVRGADGKVARVAPVETAHVPEISDAHWDEVKEGMIGATTYGTAAFLGKSVGYSVAGKTGTAQVFTVSRSQTLTDKVADRLKDHSWFIAFAPADNPRIAVCVLVENGGFGSAVAAPIARDVINAYLLNSANGPVPAGAAPAKPAETL